MKLHDPVTWLALAAFVVCVSSCSPALYSTVGQNVPLFKNKGEVAFSGGKSNSTNVYDLTRGFHAQLAMAVDSNLAVISSLYRLKSVDDETVEAWKGRGSYFEVGIGKFKPSKSGKVTSEIFVGAGLGSLKNTFERQYVNARYLKPFIQPSFGFTSKHFDAGFTLRVALVSYLSHSYELEGEGNHYISTFFSTKKRVLVFEPGITLRGGFKHVKLQIQSNYSTFSYENEDFDVVFKHYGSIGLIFLVDGNSAKGRKP